MAREDGYGVAPLITGPLSLLRTTTAKLRVPYRLLEPLAPPQHSELVAFSPLSLPPFSLSLLFITKSTLSHVSQAPSAHRQPSSSTGLTKVSMQKRETMLVEFWPGFWPLLHMLDPWYGATLLLQALSSIPFFSPSAIIAFNTQR